MYDLLIVGGGCAGCSAAITARQRNLSVLILYSGDGGLAKARRVDNYPGMPQADGAAIIRAFREQAQEMGAELKRQLVQRVMPMGDSFSVLAQNDLYEARSVLLAIGTSRVSPLPGEEELLGQGLSYCATCDGMFYKGKQMLVIGEGEEAVEEANYLAELGQVRYFPERGQAPQGLHGGIEVVAQRPREIFEREGRLGIRTAEGEHEADGIFVLRPAVAMTQLMPELEAEKKAILVDQDLMSSVPGVFAAGDIVGAPLQAAKAVGEGNRAALSIAAYLRKMAAAREET